jgi:hypothetical protein
MNKVVILKFKEEFDYWLKGGSLWYKYGNDKEWKFLEADSSEINHVFNPYNVKILINDELSEFRKALSDGEAVQYYVDGFAGWQGVKSLNQSCMHPTSFRIKPEEPKFQVGDWVRCYDLGRELIVQITGEYYPKDDAYLCSNGPRNTKFLEHWQPKLGEWCIMYDTDENPNASSVTLQKWDGKNKWKPIPFIGQLPPYIKASNES